jgi:hypothetical protein
MPGTGYFLGSPKRIEVYAHGGITALIAKKYSRLAGSRSSYHCASKI